MLDGLGVLGEVVAELLEEAPAPGAHVGLLDLGQLAEQLLLAGGEAAGGLDVDLREDVAPGPAVEVGHAVAADPEDLAALRPLGDVEVVGPVEGRYLDLG